jgi:CII-binding regulator of phage lambda lysogenization HflD
MSMDSDEEKIEGLHEDSNQESGEDEASDLVPDLSQLSPEELRQYIVSVRRNAEKKLKKKDQQLHQKDQQIHQKDQQLHQKDVENKQLVHQLEKSMSK